MKRLIGIATIIVLVALVVLSVVFGGNRIPTEKERAHIYRTAFSHRAIIDRVGVVRDVSVATRKAPFFAKRSDDWVRAEASDEITGTVRLWILGTTEGGFVTLTYSFREADNTFTVIQLDISALGRIPRPNQTLQRTPAAPAPLS